MEAPRGELKLLVVLTGPKGCGKSHIGRVLDSRLGVSFVDVEPLWAGYYSACKANGRAATPQEGIALIIPVLLRDLESRDHVSIETTGAAPEIVERLLGAWPRSDTLVAHVRAPLDLCLKRIAARSPSAHIPVDEIDIRAIHELSLAASSRADLIVDNLTLTEGEITALFRRYIPGTTERW